jgi:mutator protein MutT
MVLPQSIQRDRNGHSAAFWTILLDNSSSVPETAVAVAVILEDPSAATPSLRVLLARRPAAAIRGGLWEFPGGKIEAGERVEDAAAREAAEEVGIEIEVLASLASAADRDDRLEREQSVRLHAVIAQPRGDRVPQPLAAEELRWARLEELDALPTPPGNRAIHAALRNWAASRTPSHR